MNGNILRIKTRIPPMRGNILNRPHILAKLSRGLLVDGGFTRALSLLSAPAGFGKTTLVRAWMHAHEPGVSWLSLDPGDDDFLTFWSYLIASLQARDPALGRGALEILEDVGPSEDHAQFLVPLLNDLLSRGTTTFVVLDDYHCIDDASIHRAMAFFIEHLPPAVHLVITTRSDPPWPLARWRAREQMAEARLDALRFREDEVRAFLEDRGVAALGEAHIRALQERTEGWPTGLQLAAVSLAETPDPEGFIDRFTGNHRHILHFLHAEVLSGVGVDVRDFLVKTSILRRLSPGSCEAVTGRGDAAAILEDLVRGNLFTIPLDHAHGWYRYHPLFGQLLHHQLQREWPDAVEGLHEAAAQWYSAHDEPDEAVHHALCANRAALLGDLVDRHYHLFMRRGSATLNRVLNRLPDEAVHRHPRLAAHGALFHLVYGGRDKAEASRRAAARLGYHDPDEDREYRGILSAIDAYFCVYADDFGGARRAAEEALERLPAHNHYWRMNVGIYAGDAALFADDPTAALPHYLEAHRNSLALRDEGSILAAGTAFKVATALYGRGQVETAEKMLRETLAAAAERGFEGVARLGLLWGLRGELLRERDRLDEAEECLARAMALSEVESPSLAWNTLHLVALENSRGRWQRALDALGTIDRLDAEKRLPRFVMGRARAWEARILGERGMTVRAREILAGEGVMPGEAVSDGKADGFLVLAETMIRDGSDARETGRILDALACRADSGGNHPLLLRTLVARALLAGGSTPHLARALALGWEGGFLRAFLDFGFPLRDPLRESAAAPSTLSPGVRRYAEDILLRLHPAPARSPDHDRVSNGGGSRGDGATGLVEPLSDRQLEVLRLIGEGLSNEEVADRLFLSVGTVKWHTSNIFGRLGVKNRTEAVARARQLDIIDGT